MMNNSNIPKPPVFFMIGCQRSGSNWLRTMLGEREDMIAPHPPHIMKSFLPILSKFGDLEQVDNLKILVDHVCTFTERNQVPWLDLHNRPIIFDRPAILKSCVRTVELLRTIAIMNKNVIVPMEIIDGRYYLLAIFDEIMNTCATANGCKYWMCKSMGMSQYHDMLVTFYGKQRLRYIYLVRDPRDVTLSFMKTPVGDCHPYVIAKKWAELQNHALVILSTSPELVHQVRYENILKDKVTEVAKINDFIGTRGICRILRRGSVVVLADNEKLSQRAKEGREATNAKGLSYQFKNLGRGESFTSKQFAKYLLEMNVDDMRIVESIAFEEMTRLGYYPHVVGKSVESINFSEELIAEYKKLNEELIEKMYSDLKEENPDDLNRRLYQNDVLRKSLTCFRQSFDAWTIDREELLDYTDQEDNDEDDDEDDFDEKKSSNRFAVSDMNFSQWPKRASTVGFLSRSSVSRRLEVIETSSISLGETFVLQYASASQRGYYPSEREKNNQDKVLSGISVVAPHTNKKYVLFSVFDGHGEKGDEIAEITRDAVAREFINGVKEHDHSSTELSSKEEEVVSSERLIKNVLTKAYFGANDEVERVAGRNADSSGTTAVSLCISSELEFCVANVGDSRCILLVPSSKKCSSSLWFLKEDTKLDDMAAVSESSSELKVLNLTNDHIPDRLDERARIELNGGMIMTSEQYDAMDPSLASEEPKRVWSKDGGKWPGAAFTRSIGDLNAKKIGIVADPEFTFTSMHTTLPLRIGDVNKVDDDDDDDHEEDKNAIFFVVGSDGIFDFITNDEIADTVSQYSYNVGSVCRALLGMAYHRWCENEERTDDLSVIVGKIFPRSTLQ